MYIVLPSQIMYQLNDLAFISNLIKYKWFHVLNIFILQQKLKNSQKVFCYKSNSFDSKICYFSYVTPHQNFKYILSTKVRIWNFKSPKFQTKLLCYVIIFLKEAEIFYKKYLFTVTTSQLKISTIMIHMFLKMNIFQVFFFFIFPVENCWSCKFIYNFKS